MTCVHLRCTEYWIEIHDAGPGLSEVHTHFLLDDGRHFVHVTDPMPTGAVEPHLEAWAGHVALEGHVTIPGLSAA